MIRFLSALIALLLLPTVALADPPAGPPDPNAAYVKTIRAATWKYHDVEVAKKDGYVQMSGHVDNMGMHFSNLSIREFDLRRPNVLLYVKDGNRLRLVGVEWGFPNPNELKKAPFKGAETAVHEAACHYGDGSEIHLPSPDRCVRTHPQTGAPFAAWHPDLHNIHAYVHYASSAGVFKKENGMLAAFAPKPPKVAQKTAPRTASK